ncbi:hypothetical protein VA596_30565 [Amycolatopsis sp., V23-08]|uniref:Uncharacterized protein n=1 Tax=Amycolatopsis heterodermiae TaxID=3110235 RepID=A0ABU5RCF0_9PSEU|nr:hypothetical protein [Amycolatopsis sp., V23-08]MEA5363911.1 hypothetical protein [Amycolatopsis sp., V23-08]
MASLEDLEARVTALEEKVDQTRQDATAARVLAGAADRDVSEFKQTLNGHTKVLNAVRETQVEQDQEIKSLRADMNSGFTKVNIAIEQIAQLLHQALKKD